MFFTRQLLEQSTDEQIAAYKATRFPKNAQIVDVCCGIGGDLLALAMRGPTRGIDRDPVAALLAERNCAVHSIREARVSVEDAEQLSLDTGCFIHVDPDRRATGRRTTHLGGFSPDFDTLERLIASSAGAAIKLAPSTPVPESWREQAQLEWIGSRGECRQQVAWLGEFAEQKGIHAATLVDTRSGIPRTIAGLPAQPRIPAASRIGRFIYEPSAAVLAADLVNELASQHDLFPVAPNIAYLTSDDQVDEPLLSGFEVIDVLPFDRKSVRSRLREYGIGELEVKTRGSHQDASVLARQLGAHGTGKATLLIYKARTATAIIANRIDDLNQPSKS
jgi:hypothetical protein